MWYKRLPLELNKKMRKLIETIFGFIFPVSEEQEFLESVTSEKLSSNSEISGEIKEQNIFAVFEYGDLPKRMILCLKTSYSNKIAKTFAEILYVEIVEILSEMSLFQNFEKALIIPIPLSKSKLKKRGFNQVELIANELIKLDTESKDATLIIELDTKSLVKIKDTPKQAVAKTRKERLENPKGCFAVKNSKNIFGRNIILLDDVYTTGGTTKEASKILKEAGAKKVIILAIAH